MFVALFAHAIIETRLIGCSSLNYCNGHGRCVSATRGSPSVTCDCFEGWGSSAKDVSIDKMFDCSQRTCRGGKTPFGFKECSANGLCDRLTGLCDCFDSWEGPNCQRRSCPNQCSGRGECVILPNTTMPQCVCDDNYSPPDCSSRLAS